MNSPNLPKMHPGGATVIVLAVIGILNFLVIFKNEILP